MVGEVCGLAAAACWAVGSVLFRGLSPRASPQALNLFKCAAAGTLLGCTFFAVGGAPAGTLAGSGWLVLSAVVGLTVGDTAYFAALSRLGVAPAILLLSSAPAFAAALAWAWLGESLGARELVGMATTLAGIGVVVWRPADATARDVPRGVAYGLVAGLCQALGSVLSKRAMQEGIPALGAAAGRLVAGGLALGMVLAATGRLRSAVTELQANRTWLLVGRASLIGSFAGIWLAQTSIERTASTGIATTLLATSPLFAVPIASMAGERVGRRGVVGALLAVGGVALMMAPG